MVLVGLCVVGSIFGSLQNSSHTQGKVDHVSSLIRSLESPISVPLSQAGRGTTTFFGGLFSINRLAAENKRLKEQAAVFAFYAETVEAKTKTIDNLRRMLKFGPIVGKTRVPASVIGFSINENRLTLNVGSNQGVTAGCPVESAVALVGTVEDVEANRCQVLLLTSAGLQQSPHGAPSLIGALDVSRNPASAGLLRGENASTLSLTILDQKAPVQIGDTIVSSGYSEKIPPGMLIGKVIQVEQNEIYGYLKARIDPSFDASQLEVVYVLK